MRFDGTTEMRIVFAARRLLTGLCEPDTLMRK